MAELTGKTIAQLPDDTSLTGVELFPVMDGSSSKKISLATLRNQFAMNASGTVLEAGANLDNLLDPATYICYGIREFEGSRPTPNGFKLFVTYFYLDSGVKYCMQIAIEISTSIREYRRYHNVNGWTDWTLLDIGNLSNSLAEYVADANVNDGYTGQLRYYRIDPDTLNTPYKESVTSFGYGVILSYASSATACTQFCFESGSPNVYVRRQYQSTWSAWSKVLTSPTNVQSGSVTADVASNAITVTHVTFPSAFSSTPRVTASCSGGITSASTVANIGHLIRNITTTGFDIHVAVNTSISFSQLSYQWIAVSS